MKTVIGDLLEMGKNGDFDVIVHGCNCFNTFGAGIAKQIKEIFPIAYKVDCMSKSGDKDKLGTISTVFINLPSGKILVIINAYIQYDFRGDGVLIDYDALRNCFKEIKELFTDDTKIGYPKIGAGLARGDWNIISSIIDEELTGFNHTLIEYNQ